MNFKSLIYAFLLFCHALVAKPQTVNPPTGNDICLLSSLDLSTVTYFSDEDKNSVKADLSTYGTPLMVGGIAYDSGVGTHAPSRFVVKVNGATDFSAVFGIDDAAAIDGSGNYLPNEGAVNFTVTAYDADRVATVLKTGTLLRSDNKGTDIGTISLAGIVYLVLDFDSGANTWSDHVDVCNAYFHYAGNRPELIAAGMMWQDEASVVNIPQAPEGLEHVPLSSLDLSKSLCGWSTPKTNKSIDGNALKLKGVTYTSGVGTHAPSQMIVRLNGSVTDFYATLGIDDEVAGSCTANNTNGRADYHVYVSNGDGQTQTVARGTIKAIDGNAVQIHADVNGWKYLYLETSNGSDGGNSYDHVDWACAYFVYQEQNSSRPIMVTAEEISTKLACATTVFSQPGLRFMQKIRAANPAATVDVTHLPQGLEWNSARQLIEGTVENEGVYTYTARVTADGETQEQDITLTVSNNLQLPVPFMGWISWNSVEDEISQDIVEQIATLFKEKGLQECGWNTVVLDDWWHADTRNADGTPRPNATRFPNGIKAVADKLHAQGLKFGIYSDAAERTCAGAFGSYGKETVDANQYAAWGVDLVKYDYCNAPADVESCKERYKAMADALRASGRNILLYVCEWGAREPWKWGAEAGGVCWRTTYDVRDTWSGQSPGVGVLQSIRDMKNLSAYQGVNRFNDADMLCTGLHATGKSSNDLCGAGGPGMTQEEYRTQFALWCMWSSPLSLSFDPRGTSLTAEDIALLTNKELIALNQDRMGQQADLIDETSSFVAFAKDCENGDIALSVTNLSAAAANYTFIFSNIPHLDASAAYICRDVCEQRDCEPIADGKLAVAIKPHDTRVFRLSRKGTDSGIKQHAAAASPDVKVKKGSLQLTWHRQETTGKRILVCDAAGRVVKAMCATDNIVNISLPSGVYIVNVVCEAQATTQTVRIP